MARRARSTSSPLAKTSTRRLKVFQVQFGFFDTVVAAPSRTAALKAWGTHQDLFASGQASVTADPQAVEAALAQPGVLMKRAVGSSDPFAVEPVSLPETPKAPAMAASPKASRKAAPPPKPKPRPDRKALDAAERSLREIDDDRRQEEARLQREQDDLDTRRRTAQAAFVASRKAAEKAVAEARKAYREAGGEP